MPDPTRPATDPLPPTSRGPELRAGIETLLPGARIVGSLAKLLEQRGSGRGLISICTAGGMGVTAILER